MRLHSAWRGLAMILALGLVGCDTNSQDAGFDDVRKLVNDRTGHRVHWNQGTPEDEQVRLALRELLGRELTVDTAVQIALLNNRRMQAVYSELGVARAAVVQAGLLRNPVFDASIHFPESGGRPDLGFSLTQDFLEVFFIPLRKSIAEANFEAAKLRVAGQVMDLAADTRAAFHSAIAAEQTLEMRKQVAAATSASVEVAKRLREAGNIREIQLYTEQTLNDQAKFDVAMAEGSIVETRERLNRLMGVWGSDVQWKIGHRLPPPPDEPMDMSGLESKAVAASIDLSIARLQIESTARRLGLAKATSLVPDLALGVGAEREEGWEAGPHVSLPIPLFDQGQARIATAEAEMRGLQESYIATAVELRSAVRAARQRVVTTQQAALFYRRQVLPLGDKIVKETLLEYNAMQVGVFQLLLAKQQQIEAGRRYIDALHAYWLARTELDQLLAGRMSDPGAMNRPDVMKTQSSGPTSNQGGH